MEQIDKLIKLLMLTTSNVDAEALSAIRMANLILKKQGLTWLDVSLSLVSQKTTARPSATTGAATINEMLSFCLRRKMSERSRNFIKDLKRFHEEYGYLTEKQMSCLVKFYKGK